MGYYMRFFDTSEKPLNLETIESELKKVDQAYHLDDNKRLCGDLYYAEDIYGCLEINEPKEELFRAEIDEMLDLVLNSEDKNRVRVETVLRNTKRIVVVQVLSGNRTSEDTLERIHPLWEWLFSTRSGLLFADGEGFYDSTELVLEES